MKRLLALALTAYAAIAATQGSITMTKDGDLTHTILKVSSVTQGPIMFSVTVLYKPTVGGLNATAHQVIPRFASGIGSAAVIAVFDIPLDHVVSVTVQEFVMGEGQVFTDN